MSNFVNASVSCLRFLPFLWIMIEVCFDDRIPHSHQQIMSSDSGNVIGIYQSSTIVSTDASDVEELSASITSEKTELRHVVG